MENKEYLSARVVNQTGVSISHCYQCGKCSAGCVLASDMDYPPSYIMRLLQTNRLENDRKILSSAAIWICLNCENCIARCPQEVDIPKVMDYLREESLAAGCIHPQARPVVAFHQSFLDCVQKTGRLYEVGLILGFKLRTRRFMQDVKIAPSMFVKGKLHLLPEQVKNPKRMAAIFSKTIQQRNTEHQ